MSPLPEFLSRIFGRRSEAATTEVSLEPLLITPSAWDDDLALTLGQIATDTETRASGRVQVITLAQLRNALGEHWEQYQTKVELIAETTIGRMIGKGNVYLKHDEDSWLLLMPSLSDHDAEAKADEIARVLGEKLVGERFMEKEPPLPQAAKVDLENALRPDGSLDLEAVKQSVRRARLAIAAREAKRPSGALDQAASIAPAPTRSRFADLSMVYRPLWSADTESIDTFALRAFDSVGDMVLGRADGAAPPMDDATFADVVKAALGDFAGMIKSGLRGKYALPIPFAITRRNLGPTIFRAISAVPQRDRLMHLRIEIGAIPANTAAEHLFDLREFFRGRTRDIAFLMPLASPLPNVLAMDHVAIGVECPTSGDESDLKRALNEFRRMAGGRRTYAMGLRSRELIGSAVHAGFDEVSGPGLSDDLRHLPERTQVVHRADLLRGGPPPI